MHSPYKGADFTDTDSSVTFDAGTFKGNPSKTAELTLTYFDADSIFMSGSAYTFDSVFK